MIGRGKTTVKINTVYILSVLLSLAESLCRKLPSMGEMTLCFCVFQWFLQSFHNLHNAFDN